MNYDILFLAFSTILYFKIIYQYLIICTIIYQYFIICHYFKLIYQYLIILQCLIKIVCIVITYAVLLVSNYANKRKTTTFHPASRS